MFSFQIRQGFILFLLQKELTLPGAKNVNEAPRGNLPGGQGTELKVTWGSEDSQRCDLGQIRLPF